MAKDIRVSLELDNRKFKRDLDSSKKQVETFGATGLKTASIFRALAGAFAVREVIQFSDSITNLKNKLLTLEPSAAIVQQQFDRIRQIAFDSRSDLEGVGDLYFRIARAQESLGITSEETATIVESVSKAITASGLSSAEARGPLLQLGQALQSGRFQGDELRSILEGLPDVSRALARSLGVPIGRLKELGTQGLITGEVFVDAMRQAKASIDEAFGRTEITIGQGLSLVQTSFAGLIDTVASETGVFTSIAESLKTIATFFNDVSKSTDAIKGFGAAIVSVIASVALLRTGLKILQTPFLKFKDTSLLTVAGMNQLRTGMDSVEGSFKKAFARLVGYNEVNKQVLTGTGRLVVAFRSLVGMLAGPLGLAAAIYGVIRAYQGYYDLQESKIIEKIKGQGEEKTLEEIDKLNERIKTLTETTKEYIEVSQFSTRDSAGFQALKTAGEIDKLQKRVDALYSTLKEMGPPLPPEMAQARKELADLEKKAKQTQTAIINFMVGLKTEERTPEKFAAALKKLNELFGDRKTNEQILEYEKNLKEIYRLFGEEMPKKSPFQQINEDIAKIDDFETYNAVLDKITEGFKTGNISYDERILLMGKLKDSLTDAEMSMASFKNAIQDIDVQISDNLVDSLLEGTNAIDALKATFKNAVKQMLADAIRLLFIQKILGGIFGAFGYNVDFLPGGGISDITKKAMGGPVMPNKPYLVGEQGPEILVPGTSGTIIPNHDIGGVQNVYYNINATDAQSFQALLSRDRQFVHALVTKANRDLPSGRRF